jgi:hypothetical protein
VTLRDICRAGLDEETIIALDANDWRSPCVKPPITRRVVTSHRLMATDPDAETVVPQVSVVDLRLAEADVRERKEEMVAQAHVLGSGHSLRIWRAAHQEALLALTREVSGTSAGADCRSIVWIREGALFHVSATFITRPNTVH